jgi:hypothetical protein
MMTVPLTNRGYAYRRCRLPLARHLAVYDAGDRIDQKRVVGDLVEAVQYCRVGEYPATCVLHAVAVELDFLNPSIAASGHGNERRAFIAVLGSAEA